MHRSLRHRVARAATGDEGLGMVEVLAAILIFSMLSLGLLHTLLSVLTVSRDARARQVATNIAAQTIDAARTEENLFDLLDSSTTFPMANGDEYFVTTTSQWVSDPGVSLACGAGGGILRYKRINVQVTWNNMRESTKPVRADTILNPDQRINDPTMGTILVSVINGAGEGSAGVTITATPTVGGAAVAPATTDAQGCAYMLMVEPGQYDVKAQRTNYVDVNHAVLATTTVTVGVGSAAPVAFQYDLAATFTVNLGTSFPSPVKISKDMPVVLASTYGDTVKADNVTTATRTYKLHPFASGYTGFVGQCGGADPLTWPNTIVGADTVVGYRPDLVGAPPGGSATLEIPVGVVGITVSGTKAVTAVSRADPAGEHPTCATAVTLSFGNLNGAQTLALPYGSWEVRANGTPIAATALTTGRVTGQIVTLDPRVVEVVP